MGAAPEAAGSPVRSAALAGLVAGPATAAAPLLLPLPRWLAVAGAAAIGPAAGCPVAFGLGRCRAANCPCFGCSCWPWARGFCWLPATALLAENPSRALSAAEPSPASTAGTVIACGAARSRTPPPSCAGAGAGGCGGSVRPVPRSAWPSACSRCSGGRRRGGEARRRCCSASTSTSSACMRAACSAAECCFSCRSCCWRRCSSCSSAICCFAAVRVSAQLPRSP